MQEPNKASFLLLSLFVAAPQNLAALHLQGKFAAETSEGVKQIRTLYSTATYGRSSVVTELLEVLMDATFCSIGLFYLVSTSLG
jgi:hypothetical protein